MKICLVSDQYGRDLDEIDGADISGIGIHTCNLVEGLLEHNCEVTLICNKKQQKPINNFRYIYLPTFGLFQPPNSWITFAFKLARNIKKLQKRYKFDIFHCLDAREGSLAARKLSIPTIGNGNDYYSDVATFNPFYYIKNYRANWPVRYLYYNFVRKYEKWTFQNYDRLIANSRRTCRYLQKCVGGKTEIILMYKALSSFPSLPNQIKEKKNKGYNILMIGANLQTKGIFDLIKAAPVVLRDFPEVTFHIIGKDMPAMLNLCHKLDVIERFRFYGTLKHSELEKHYKIADIFVLASVQEGFGLTAVEAMSHGIPVVGTKGTGLEDSILDGRNGYLVPPKSSIEIARTIARLLKNKEVREKISSNNFQDAKCYNKEVQLKQTLELYHELLERK